MIRLFEILLLPPGSLIWLATAGLVLLRTRRRRLGITLLTTALALLYLACTPLVMAVLLRSLDRYPPLDPAAAPPGEEQAIVILSAGLRLEAREYGRDTAAATSLERLRYGAWLQQRLGHPILITGSAGKVMARTLQDELGAEARWVETESRNTYEHTVHSAGLLRDAGIERIYLVTHFWHMPRAMRVFSMLDVEAVAAPMGFSDAGPEWYDLRWILPGSSPLCANALALHEWVGRLWYRLRYGV